jgi:hypothetical protein
MLKKNHNGIPKIEDYKRFSKTSTGKKLVKTLAPTLPKNPSYEEKIKFKIYQMMQEIEDMPID